VELGLELERELSPARYLRQHSHEFPTCADDRAVPAAIEAAVALEECDRGLARRHWRVVVASARSAGLKARASGVTPRRLVGEVERLRTAMETVLFDGRLPPDLAAWAARSAAKMCTRAVEHALCAYWSDGRSTAARVPVPPFRGYGPEQRLGAEARGRRTFPAAGTSDQMGDEGRPGVHP